MLTKDQIRIVNDRPRKWLPIQDWTPDGETFDPTKHGVYVGSLTARDKDAFERDFLKPDGRDNSRAKLAVLTVQDAEGNRVFADADADWLGQKSAAPLSAIFDLAIQVNRMGKADHKELVENF